jgi:ribosomal protein S20
VGALPAAWDRISREASITKGGEQWAVRLQRADFQPGGLARYHEGAGNETRARASARNRDQAEALRDVMETLIRRLEPLCEPQPAATFIKKFDALVNDYLDPNAEAIEEVKSEIDQLGTVGAVGGSFSLATFAQASQRQSRNSLRATS